MLGRLKMIFGAVLLLATMARAEVSSFSVLPSATDSAIKTFDAWHWIYLNREIVVEHKAGLAADRHELLLFIPGTGRGTNDGAGPSGFLKLAANLGYHAVFLKYPNDRAAADCREDGDASAFERFRMAIIQGGQAKYIGINGSAKIIAIERADSIENRLAKLLAYLKTNRPPEETWGELVEKDGGIKWESVAVSGLSQGGGHAALLGIKHRVARVLCFGAPKDYNIKLDAPAGWYDEKSATSKDRFFAFNHRQDPMGCTPEEQLKNLAALKLDAFGPVMDVDATMFPFEHSRMLTTGYPVVTITAEASEGGLTAHTSVVVTRNADHWKDVWTYMLTEKTQ